jgi:hypothetical protein
MVSCGVLRTEQTVHEKVQIFRNNLLGQSRACPDAGPSATKLHLEGRAWRGGIIRIAEEVCCLLFLASSVLSSQTYGVQLSYSEEDKNWCLGLFEQPTLNTWGKRHFQYQEKSRL